MLDRTGIKVIAILLLFWALGIGYSLVVPPFETPDEIYHYAFARHLAQGNSLPIQDMKASDPWSHEGSQAPLYYLLVGWLTSGIDQNDFEQINRINERANMGNPQFPGNKNRMLYSADQHPLQGANLALHMGRWFSLILGSITLLVLFQTARLTFPEQPSLQLCALLFVATIPQFIFISASFSNDSMITAVSAITIYWLIRLLTKSAHNPIDLREWIALGVLLGLAGLSKLQGLGLWLVAALTGVGIAWRRHDWTVLIRALLPVAVPALLICGWWYWRNYALYGDLFGRSVLIAINGQREDALSWTTLWGELRGLRYSFWGLFGWFNILLPTPLYRLFDAITILGVIGLFPAFYDHRARREFKDSIPNRDWNQWLLLLWSLLLIGMILYWIRQATSSQGRLLFPAITAIGLLLAWGNDYWLSYLPRSIRSTAWATQLTAMVGSSLYALLILLPASYQAPLPITTIPESVPPANITYGDVEQGQDRLTLLALEVPSERFYPGELVPVTLYVQASAPIEDDYQLFIQFLDEIGTEVGNLTSHPGWGRNPTSLWQPGAIYADHYLVPVQELGNAYAPLIASVYTGFINPQTEETGRFPIPAYTIDGEEIVPKVANVALIPTEPPSLDGYDLVKTQSLFGNVIQLSGFSLPEALGLSKNSTLIVTLLWDAIGTPATDYTAYVHLLNAAGLPITGFDQPPANTRFPTQYWRAGDRILSQFEWTVPADVQPGEYQAWLGLYESDSGGAIRLPVTDDGGLSIMHNQVGLGTIKIQK